MSTWMKRRIERSRARCCQRASQKGKTPPQEQKAKDETHAASRKDTPYAWTRDEVI